MSNKKSAKFKKVIKVLNIVLLVIAIGCFFYGVPRACVQAKTSKYLKYDRNIIMITQSYSYEPNYPNADFGSGIFDVEVTNKGNLTVSQIYGLMTIKAGSAEEKVNIRFDMGDLNKRRITLSVSNLSSSFKRTLGSLVISFKVTSIYFTDYGTYNY